MTGPPGGSPDGLRAPDLRMIGFTPAPPATPPRRVVADLRRSDERSRIALIDPRDGGGDSGVRPFVVTGGRTRPVDARLRIETQVVTTPAAAGTALDPERRRIVELCRAPMSVAEVGAALRLPLGVARVLIADLSAVGFVVIHEPPTLVTRATIERILERVHAI